MSTETPDTVHGRLLESVHLSGYSFERACGELEWLLDDDRWKRCGGGYGDINAFLETLDISKFKIPIEQRQKLAKRLASIRASQSATARVLGVDEGTVRNDLGKKRKSEKSEQSTKAPSNSLGETPSVSENSEPKKWFQNNADPTREAKRVERNTERQQERQQIQSDRPQRDVPSGRFSLLYADPPWRYEHVETESRAIENQYPTMSLDEICALEVPAADDAVLFLWATSPKLADAIRVIDAWRFSYRTCAVWDKELIGMGYYFRQQHELLLVAARGSLPVPEPSTRPSSVLRERRGKHSSKPTLVYELLEQMYPTFTERDRVELFARVARNGWTSWSNEPAVAS